jgi:hypothetical protein
VDSDVSIDVNIDRAAAESPSAALSSVSKVSASDREPMLYCPVCSLRLAERKCKLYCERCGYYMSCADYY